MHLLRDRAPAPSFLPPGFVDPASAGFARLDRTLIPAPAALPSLTEALARRAETFGPLDLDEPEAGPRGLLARLGGLLRGAADLLDPVAVTW